MKIDQNKGLVPLDLSTKRKEKWRNLKMTTIAEYQIL